MTPIFTTIFLIALTTSLVVRIFLAARHVSHIKSHRDKVPSAFAATITLPSHQKAADYSIAKTKLSFAAIILDFLLILAFTLGGGISLLGTLIGNLAESEIARGVAFLISLVLITSMLEMPITLVKTFIIETKFGFNNMSFKTWLGDLLKQAFLASILGIPLLFIILGLMSFSGNLWWLYSWVVLMCFIGLVQFIGPTYIAPIFNKFTPLEDGELKTCVEQLLQKCGFASSGLFIMDGSKRSSHGNAYFTGFGKNKRIVFFDTLIERLGVAEIEAVLAHELGHFRLNHVYKRLFIMATSSLILLAVLGFVKNQAWFFTSLNVPVTTNDGIALGLFFLVIPVFTFILQPILAKLSRNHEYEADRYASEHSPTGELVNALVKLYNDNASTLTPDPLFSAWYDSHPPASLRIAKLESFNDST